MTLEQNALKLLKLATVTVTDIDHVPDSEPVLDYFAALQFLFKKKKYGEFVHMEREGDDLIIYGTSKSKSRLNGTLREIKRSDRGKFDYKMNADEDSFVSSMSQEDQKNMLEEGFIHQVKINAESHAERRDSINLNTYLQDDLRKRDIQLTEAAERESVLEERLSLFPTSTITAEIGDEYLILGFKDVELPKLEACTQLYDSLMVQLGIVSEGLADAVNKITTGIEDDVRYKRENLKLTRATGALEGYEASLARLGDLPEDSEESPIESLEESIRIGIRAANVEIEKIKKEYSDAQNIVKEFRDLFSDESIHYLITQSETTDETGSYYVISVTTPIAYRTGTETYRELELDLLSHIQTEWNRLRDEIKGEIEPVDNNSLLQYNFKVPKSGTSIDDIKAIQKKLGDAIYKSQSDYMFSQLGLRLNIKNVDNTDSQSLSVDSLVGQEYVPEPVPEPITLNSQELSQERNHSSNAKQIPGEIQTEYSRLAEEARRKGIKITDDPKDISSAVYDPNDLLLMPRILLAASEGGASKRSISDYLHTHFPDIEESDLKIKMDAKLTLLKVKGMIHSENNIWRISPAYMNNQNG